MSDSRPVPNSSNSRVPAAITSNGSWLRVPA